jgi:hypothetical protein
LCRSDIFQPEGESGRRSSLEKKIEILVQLEGKSVKVALREELVEKLEKIRTFLVQEPSDHSYSSLIDKIADLLLAKLEKKTPLPPTSEVKKILSETRYISMKLRRAIRQRDQNQCTAEMPTGRCEETNYLQFEHIIPFGKGGIWPEENAGIPKK